jgi:hypothetical protein
MRDFQLIDEVLSFLNEVVYKLADKEDVILNKRHYNDNFQLILLLCVKILFNSIDYEK